jgi:alkenylglycerophosphocholine/alkenylglycerophosphoethanolamine hydrolase
MAGSVQLASERARKVGSSYYSVLVSLTMGRNVRSVFLVGGLLSLAYFVIPSVYVKPWPIWCLSIVAFTSGSRYGRWIGIGLLCSSVGDVLLELDNLNPTAGLFIPGLLAFLAAHVVYIVAFYQSHLDYKHVSAIAVPVAAFYLSINAVLLRKMERGLILPVLIYGLAISTMALLGTLRSFSDKSCGRVSRYCCLIGSLVFVLSDSILAINKFAFPIQDAHFYIMVTYYFAQTYLAASTVKSSNAKEP